MKVNSFETDALNSIGQYDRRILFVDDEDEILKALKRALRSEPYQQYFASSGKEALDLMSRYTIHVLVSDMRMPQMDGVELLKTVAQRYPDIVRMVISGWGDADSILEAINNGHIYRYLVKPWDPRELKMTLRQALDMYQLQTERRELLQQLTEKNRNLERTVMHRAQQVMAVNQQAEIGKYASQIVQKLAEPLNNISAGAELIGLMAANETVNIDRLRNEISSIQGHIDRMKQFVSGITSHVQKETTTQVGLININKIIQEEMEYFELDPLFRYEIKKKLKLASNLPQIMGNSVQLKQVLNHLIKNAIAAMASTNEKHLYIETMLQANTIIISISDTGVGIPPEDRDRIFSNDFAAKSNEEGNGLGLYTTKSLVAAYSGSIDFTSELQQGTTFRVSLPVGRTIINPSLSLH